MAANYNLRSLNCGISLVICCKRSFYCLIAALLTRAFKFPHKHEIKSDSQVARAFSCLRAFEGQKSNLVEHKKKIMCVLASQMFIQLS